MKALTFKHYGSPNDVLTVTEDYPKAFINIHGDYALVKVAACSASHHDWKGVEGFFGTKGDSFIRKEVGLIPGCSISGVIVAIGKRFEAKSKLVNGDEVIGICHAPYLNTRLKNFLGFKMFGGDGNNVRKTGGMAEYVAVRHDFLALKPQHLSHTQAATLAYNGVLSFMALKDFAGASLEKWKERKENGDPIKILVLNGANDIGKLCIQIGKCFEASVYAVLHKKNSGEDTLADETFDKSNLSSLFDLQNYFDVVVDCGLSNSNEIDNYTLFARLLRNERKYRGRFVDLCPEGERKYTTGRYVHDTLVANMVLGKYPYLPVKFNNKKVGRYLQAISKLAVNSRIKPTIGRPIGQPSSIYTSNNYFPFSNQGAKCLFNLASDKNETGKLILIVNEDLCGKPFLKGNERFKFNTEGGKAQSVMNSYESDVSESEGYNDQYNYKLAVKQDPDSTASPSGFLRKPSLPSLKTIKAHSSKKLKDLKQKIKRLSLKRDAVKSSRSEQSTALGHLVS